LTKKDFVYVHAELTDEVMHGTDLKAKVRGIEEVDRHLVGPLVEGLARQGPYRFIVICDHAADEQGEAIYAFGEGGGQGAETAGRRFTEADALAANMPARDATKFMTKFFSKN
jgi:2,3-bisphosphoglycerate-independent phosphoglycerate mutase